MIAAGIDTGATQTVLPYYMAEMVHTRPAAIRTADGKHEARLATENITMYILGHTYMAKPISFRDRALLGLDIL